MRKKGQKGFTLIELLVVISIISLLASVVLVSLNGARAKARSAKRLSDLRQVTLAIELYYDKYGSYPSTGGAWWSCNPSGGSHNTDYVPGLVPEFMSSLPHDPLENCAGSGSPPYEYAFMSNGTDYKLFMPWGVLENCSAGTIYIDPVRTCDNGVGNDSWVTFSPGAINW